MRYSRREHLGRWKLVGINDGNDQFDLSFDRYCSVENVYIFRITYHNYALRIRDLERITSFTE